MSRVAIRNVILILVLLVILVVLFLLLRPSSTQDSSTTSESTSAEPQQNNFNLAITGETMTPDAITVSEGEQVNLQITSDHPAEFHLHGYDLETEVEPGEPAELAFDATITGRFAIEDHNTETELGVLLVQPS
jgi:heme/copper-type cytochrome/quinol oxidase subunit 2